MVAIITGRVPRHTQNLHRARTATRAPSLTGGPVLTQPPELQIRTLHMSRTKTHRSPNAKGRLGYPSQPALS